MWEAMNVKPAVQYFDGGLLVSMYHLGPSANGGRNLPVGGDVG